MLADLPLFAALPDDLFPGSGMGIAARAARGGHRHPLDLPGVRRPLVFASGSNDPGEIYGFAAVGMGVGVTAPRVKAASEAALRRLAGVPDAACFLDSGAFNAFTKGVDITPAEWEERLALYDRLATVFGSRLYCVAPDKIADQAETLALLTRYRDRVRGWYGHGAQVLVALQGGALGLSDFYRQVVAVLGFTPVPAFPMRHAATDPSAVTAFVTAHTPERIHLLGLGWESALTKPLLRTLAYVSPTTMVSLDSCLVTASVGRTNGPGGTRRELTVAQDAWREHSPVGPADINAWGDAYDPAFDAGLDYTDWIAFPSRWLGPAGLALVANDAGLAGAARAAWEVYPDAFLQMPTDATDRHYTDVAAGRVSPWDAADLAPTDDADWERLPWYEAPELASALDGAWARWLQNAYTARRKAAAIATVFSTHPAAWQFSPLITPGVYHDALALGTAPHLLGVTLDQRLGEPDDILVPFPDSRAALALL